MRYRSAFSNGLIFLCTVVFYLQAAGYPGARAEDWPRWRGPDADGISMETDWDPEALNRPRILWKASVGTGYSSVAVKDRYLYTMGNEKNIDTVYCINAVTGKEIWHYSYPCMLGLHPGPRVTPTIDGNSVYTLSRDGDLFCFNAENGKVRWKMNITSEFRVSPPKWGFAGSPVIEEGLLILNAGVSGVALNKKTGKKIWFSKTGTGGYAAPVIYDYNGKRCAAIFGEKALYAVEAKTGKLLWSYPWRTEHDVNAADPLVVGNRVFISSNYGKGCVLLEMTGKKPKVLWQNNRMSSHFSSFIYLDGYIYGNDGSSWIKNSVFRCLDINTGEEMWGEALGFGSLIAVSGKLIMLNAGGDLFIAEATHHSYREIARAEKVLARTCWTPPVFWNGGIFCRNLRGDLIYISFKK